jgi:formate hydrogenlyase subunit 6/NADH:ubiquinone oxidoreductase subunit I
LAKKLKKKDLKPIERNTPLFQKTKKRGWRTRLPILKQRFRKKQYPRGFDTEAGQYIPVNLRVGDYESEVIPLKLMDYFIDKAGTIVIRDCPCRVTNDCKNHDKDLGCIWMGKGAANLNLKKLPGMAKEGRYATKEEAKEHARLALKNGLAPALAKLRGDAVAYNVLEYDDELMNFCFCCSCCCIAAGYKYGNSDYKNYVKRMKGVTFVTDPEKCVGCGECFKVCIYNGLRLEKGKSVHTEDCLGCGHCEAVCPEGAISINFDENMNIDEVIEEIIQRYEKIVDISG